MEVMDGGQVGADRRGWIGGNVDSTTARSRLPAGIDKLTVTLSADETVERAAQSLLGSWAAGSGLLKQRQSSQSSMQWVSYHGTPLPGCGKPVLRTTA